VFFTWAGRFFAYSGLSHILMLQHDAATLGFDAATMGLDAAT